MKDFKEYISETKYPKEKNYSKEEKPATAAERKRFSKSILALKSFVDSGVDDDAEFEKLMKKMEDDLKKIKKN
jgi:molecular chaperone DnaK (HSP70)